MTLDEVKTLLRGILNELDKASRTASHRARKPQRGHVHGSDGRL